MTRKLQPLSKLKLKENSSWSVAHQEAEHLTRNIHPRPLTCEDCAAVCQGVYSQLKKNRNKRRIFKKSSKLKTEKLSQSVKMIFNKKKREDEIFDIRQRVYVKLNQGRNVYSLMRMFKWKVEKYLRTFRAELCMTRIRNGGIKLL